MKYLTLKMKFYLALLLMCLCIIIITIGCGGKKDRKGVIIVLLDALRRDHLSFCGYDRPTSPFLDSLIKKSVFFRNVVSAAPQTVPSVSSLLTGLYPYRHGSHFFSVTQSYHPTRSIDAGGLPLMKPENLLLAEVFAKAGYRTAAVSSNPGIRNVYGYAQGIEYFRYVDCFSETGAGVCDGSKVNRIFENDVLPRIKKDDFFVYLHYMDVHYPYFKPNSFKGRFIKYSGEPVYMNGKPDSITSEQLEYTQACYDEGVIYLDGLIKELFKIIENAGLTKSTLIIIVADHGDEFMEHGGLGHGTTCYNELINSFILMINPALKPGIYDTPASLVDVFPTVLNWVGIDPPANLDGLSILPDLKDGKSVSREGKRALIAELGDRKAIIDGKWRFIYNLDTKTSELYDTLKDPGETRNLAEAQKSLTKKYLAIIKQIVKKMTISYSIKSLSRSELKTLKSLGYIH
jgi:arylsulfatase A-like enzyme